MTYKGYEIEVDSFTFTTQQFFTVYYQGDEVVFEEEWEAKQFIDEITA